MHFAGFAIGIFACGAAASVDGSYKAPRLDNGQPDMQGVWIASNATPLQRPAGFADLFISEADAARLLAALEARAEDRSQPTEPTEYFESFHIERVRGRLRSSIIVEPANGQLPGNERFRMELAAARAAVINAMDGPEQRPAPERCLASQTVQPPILSIRTGVNLHQIVQTNEAFVFWSEFAGATRIIRLNAKPLPAVLTSWLGDSIAHWEGDSLVVTTTGFHPADRARLGFENTFLVSQHTVVTERFTRISADEIDYRFKVEDPTFYTQPWIGESHFLRRDERVLEYACHEGNYSLRWILEAARARERGASQ